MITTASELWETWTKQNTLRPGDYDTDIADLVRAKIDLPDLSHVRIPHELKAQDWPARKLIHVIKPALSSFSGMLNDLLGFYEKIDATKTDKDGLIIKYEFEDGSSIDEELKHFRQKVSEVERIHQSLQSEITNAWSNPVLRHVDRLRINAFEKGMTSLDLSSRDEANDWLFSSEIPRPLLDDPIFNEVLVIYPQVIRSFLMWASELGNTLNLARQNPSYGFSDDPFPGGLLSDYWWIQEIGLLTSLPELSEKLRQPEKDSLANELLSWLKDISSQMPNLEDQIQQISDVLQLPVWGQRFDLYSAWIASLIDSALDPNQIRFDVADGVLAFPFRETLLARIQTRRGEIELWTERRYRAKNLKGAGRKNHIQPDYVLVDGNHPDKAIAAIEVKQYQKPSDKNHGEAAHDYAHNLPDAEVIMVAHGVLGKRVKDHVDEADKARVHLREDVRPGCDSNMQDFRKHMRRLLPAKQAEKLESTKGSAKREAVPVIDNERNLLEHEHTYTKEVFVDIEVWPSVDASEPPFASISVEWNPALYEWSLQAVPQFVERDTYYQRIADHQYMCVLPHSKPGSVFALIMANVDELDLELHLETPITRHANSVVPVGRITSDDKESSISPVRISERYEKPVWRIARIDSCGDIA